MNFHAPIVWDLADAYTPITICFIAYPAIIHLSLGLYIFIVTVLQTTIPFETGKYLSCLNQIFFVENFVWLF